MKKTSKVMAMAMALVLTFSMLPMTVLAANSAGDIAGIKFGGKEYKDSLLTISASVGDGSEEMVGVNTNMVTVNIPEASANSGASVLLGITQSLSTDTTTKLIKAADASGLTDSTTITAGKALGAAWIAQELEQGDVVLVIDGVSDTSGAIDIQVIAFLVNIIPDGTLIGESTVDNVIVTVVIPTNLDFAIDPLDLGGSDNQITSSEYFAVNKTGVPVLVDVAVTVAPGSDVSLVDDIDDLDQAFPDGRTIEKSAYFGMLGASAVAASKTIEFSMAQAGFATGGPYFDYDAEEAGVLSVIDPDSNEGNIQFSLDAATGGTKKTETQTTLAASNKGVSSFTFYAELNTYADWKDGDLNVTGVYTLTAMRGSDVPETTVGLNVVQKIEYPQLTSSTTSVTLNITKANYSDSNPYIVVLTEKPANITSVTIPASSYTYTADNYSYDATTGELTLKFIPTASSDRVIKITAGSYSYTLDLKFS